MASIFHVHRAYLSVHNGGTTSASIISVDKACVFGSTEKYQTKEERKTERSQTEEQSETAQAVSSSDDGECAVVGKQAR